MLISHILSRLGLLGKPVATDLECNLAVDVNEKLGNYWKCLSGIDQKRWFTKELYLREELKIKTLDDYNMSLISLGQRGEKCISGICNYDILRNERQADVFFYTPMEKRFQQFQFESSDIVAKIIYLGEEKIIDIHNKYQARAKETNDSVSSSDDSSDEEKETNLKTSLDMMKTFKMVQKTGNSLRDQSTKDKLLTKFKTTFGDIGENLDADFGDIGLD